MNPNTEGIKPGIAVRVGTLAAFLAELPPAATIRLMQTYRQHECFRTISLHLQALTTSGEVRLVVRGASDHVLAGGRACQRPGSPGIRRHAAIAWPSA